MDNVIRYRAMASLYRQHAAYNPNESWKLLAQAEHWSIWPDWNRLRISKNATPTIRTWKT